MLEGVEKLSFLPKILSVNALLGLHVDHRKETRLGQVKNLAFILVHIDALRNLLIVPVQHHFQFVVVLLESAFLCNALVDGT